eukprot:6757528-Prymnesium_polylepis.1
MAVHVPEATRSTPPPISTLAPSRAVDFTRMCARRVEPCVKVPRKGASCAASGPAAEPVATSSIHRPPASNGPTGGWAWGWSWAWARDGRWSIIVWGPTLVAEHARPCRVVACAHVEIEGEAVGQVALRLERRGRGSRVDRDLVQSLLRLHGHQRVGQTASRADGIRHT